MGQINTNNYPAVDSLLDADLLIVENATRGTGTTTPKQLRENAIGTDTLQTTAQTVTGAINEIFEMATDTVVGLELGKMTSFSDGVIVTDIDLHRAPVAGDRILFYHSAAVASPSSLTTYNDGVAVTTTIGDFSLTHPAGLTLMKCVALGESLRWQTVQDIAEGGYTAGTGISINGTTINNSAPQLGDDIAYSKIDTVTSGALGYFNADADCLVMDFRTDAEPYNGGYTLRLTTTGASFKYAVLKDKAGNNYAEEIPAGSLVMCKSNVSGTGSEADPVVVTVLEIGNTEMVHDVEVLKDICITEKTVSGNPITLTDALPYPALSLSADIEPIQDLHGYDKPWIGGAGKNLCPMTLADIKSRNTIGTWSGNKYTLNDLSFDVLTDSADNVTGIKANGTPSANTSFYINGNVSLASGSYIASVSGSSVPSGVYISLRGTGISKDLYGSTVNQTFNISSDVTDFVAYIFVSSGTALSDYTIQPMLRLSSVSDATFAPYSNICPISGHTSVTITRTDAESQTATVTIQLGQTVYGGSVDFTTGVAVVKYAMINSTWKKHPSASYNHIFYIDNVGAKTFPATELSTAKSNLLPTVKTTNIADLEALGYGLRVTDVIYIACEAYTTAEQFNTWATNNGLQVCYELATPLTLTLTPVAVQMLKGYNQISSDGGGDLTITYKADRLAAIEAALAALQ